MNRRGADREAKRLAAAYLRAARHGHPRVQAAMRRLAEKLHPTPRGVEPDWSVWLGRA